MCARRGSSGIEGLCLGQLLAFLLTQSSSVCTINTVLEQELVCEPYKSSQTCVCVRICVHTVSEGWCV